jgi:ABC-type protease/lipase transport system fused ATPase/permease subunit
VVIVAHRAGILAAVDRVLILRDGKIEKLGVRDEVLTPPPPAKGASPVSLAVRRSAK